MIKASEVKLIAARNQSARYLKYLQTVIKEAANDGAYSVSVPVDYLDDAAQTIIHSLEAYGYSVHRVDDVDTMCYRFKIGWL